MSVYKIVEIVGTSNTSISDAVTGAVQRAGTTLQGLEWFEVKEIRGRIQDNEIEEFQVKLDIGFLLHAPKAPKAGATAVAKRTPGTRRSRSLTAQAAAKRGERGRSDLARGFRSRER